MTKPAAAITPDRAGALLAQMTLAEKIGQLHMVSLDAVITGPTGALDGLKGLDQGGVGSILNIWGDGARALQKVAIEGSRLGIPLLFALDVLHGHRTVFPIPLGEASAFDPAVWEATAREAARETAEDGIAMTFAPMLDVSRDPRWGRIAESPGEDPVVGARFATAKVAGFQGADLRDPTRVAAVAKHFAAYGAGVGGREYDSVDVSDEAMRRIYLPPFRAAVAAGVAAIMPAFMDVAGIPMTANPALLRDELRQRWGFDGVTVSDYNSVAELIAHGVSETGTDAAALALRSGNDIDMVSGLYVAGLPQAIEAGLVTMTQLDEAVLRMLRLKERLGLFDEPYRHCPPTTPGEMAQRRAIARDAGRRSIVLLTNPNDILPLKPTLGGIAVIGPLASSRQDMQGPWAATGDTATVVTFAEGVKAAWPDAAIEVVDDGSPAEPFSASFIAQAVAAAGRAEVAILCLGETAAMSGEAAARAHPILPPDQQGLLDAVAATGTPVVVLLSCGRPLVAPELFDAPCATVATWFLGSEAGHAAADVLSGRHSPSGRLPVSWPRAVGQIPIYYARNATGRPHKAGDRYTTGYADELIEPRFAFGHGLSYSRFVLSDLEVASDGLGLDQPVRLAVTVTNTGDVMGEDTVLLFAHARIEGRTRPLLELRDFLKATLEPGRSARLHATSTRRILAGLADTDLSEGAPQPRLNRLDIAAGHSAAAEGQLRAEIEL